MRWAFLLVMVLAVAVPLLAEDPAVDTSATGQENSELFGAPASPLVNFHFHFRAAERRDHDRGFINLQALTPRADPVCYTMRTYVEERESPRSDVTRVVASSTCQWSSKFGLKSTVLDRR